MEVQLEDMDVDENVDVDVVRSNNGQVVTNSQPTDTRGWLHCKKKYRPPVKELLINYLTVQQKNMFSYFVKIISIGINISKKIQL